MSEPTSQMKTAREAIQAAGLAPPDRLVADGHLHLLHLPGDPSGSPSAWYTTFPSLASGAAGTWEEILISWGPQPRRAIELAHMRHMVDTLGGRLPGTIMAPGLDLKAHGGPVGWSNA